ncbi:MAG: hypothetical protein JRG76_02175 [Deltaproteobacteria bacterium]|nr:hypothetical protein [Deltaproteobacteria bacterium]MBW2413293.1 hypothetical protein [Deltaproteobacteria bacterium]
MADRLEKIPELLAERAAHYAVPGASLAVMAGGYLNFLDFDGDGRARYLHTGSRTAPRVS